MLQKIGKEKNMSINRIVLGRLTYELKIHPARNRRANFIIAVDLEDEDELHIL